MTATPDPLAAVRAHVAAFTEGRLDDLLARFAPDAVFRTGATVASTPDERRALFGGAIERLGPTLVITTEIADGDAAACELREELVHEGVHRSSAVAGFYRVRDGLIVGATIYREGSAEL